MRSGLLKPNNTDRRFPLLRRQQAVVGQLAKKAGIHNPVRALATQPQSYQTKSASTLAVWCGMGAVLIYFIRGTVFPIFLHIPTLVLMVTTGAILMLAVGISIANGGGCRWSWVFVLFAFGLGIIQAEQFGTAALHWAGLVLVILAVGPVILNPAATAIRTTAWHTAVNGMTILSAVFTGWYALRLPSFGAGHFSSFMNHCMLLGPIAGMGAVIALARALRGRFWQWGLLSICGIVPVLASGSRVATVATLAGFCFLIIRRKPILGLGLLILFISGIFAFVHLGRNLEKSKDTLTGAISYKGSENTRADLWQARIDEFKSSPIFGIGVAMGTGSGSQKEADGSIRVEPGSSYLAILAMTGTLGTIAFLSAMGLLWLGYATSQRSGGVNGDILNGVGIFLAVHGLAEGWILGFGSPLCFLFWLWLGNFGDAAQQPVQPVANRRIRPPVKVRTVQPTPATN